MFGPEKRFAIHVATKGDDGKVTPLLTMPDYDSYWGFGFLSDQGVTSHEVKENGKLEVYRWDSYTTPDTPNAVMIEGHPYILLGELKETQPVESPDVPNKDGSINLVFSLETIYR